MPKYKEICENKALNYDFSIKVDGVQYLSVCGDVPMHVCDLTTIRANEKWRLLSEEVKKEVAEFLNNLQFPGKGNKTEPVFTFKGVLKLVMLVLGRKQLSIDPKYFNTSMPATAL